MTDQPSLTLNDGHNMPQIGLGVYQIPDDDTARVVQAAIDAGYRAVDTAALYGNEAGTGAGIRARTETIFVTSKLWRDDFGYDAALRGFDRSFEKLGLEWIDLFLLHWPFVELDQFVESWRALVRLQQDGRVRSIGVSNFTIDHLERIIHDTGVVPAVNQIELHPSFQQVELRAFHDENRIVTTSWSPLGQGAALEEPVLARIAEKHGKSPAQVVLRWHIESGLSVIPKSTRPERLAENIAIFDFALDAEDHAAIGTLDRRDGRIGPDPRTMA
ncbi:MAG TPA: aldo/keto reductase [Sphingomonas sp.]|jgi:2,5-diketo-D-gluconate reductase A|uniref:aldo/keto reductase n=1 Tax=Sphingomonas sp. TaxID=28214 RepID=UPI002ED774DB